MSVFGAWLQGQFEARGWDQRQAAHALGVRESSVHNWLHQDVRPNFQSVMRLARALEQPIDEVARQAGYDDIPKIKTKKQASNERAEILSSLPQFEEILDMIGRKPLAEQQVYIGIIRRILLDPHPGGTEPK